MEYSFDHIKESIDKAIIIINKKLKNNKFVRGKNDCFAFLIEYDNQLRNGSKLSNLKLDPYNSSKEFFTSINTAGFNSLNDLAEYAGYEPKKDKRPQHGDIAYELLPNRKLGSAMIAADGYWVTTSENDSGIIQRRQIFYYERRLIFLAKPIRS